MSTANTKPAQSDHQINANQLKQLVANATSTNQRKYQRKHQRKHQREPKKEMERSENIQYTSTQMLV